MTYPYHCQCEPTHGTKYCKHYWINYRLQRSLPNSFPLIEGEEWRFYNHILIVSSHGRLAKRIGRSKYRLRVKLQTNAGYHRLNINRHKIFLHEMILEMFVGPRPKGKITRHLDGNPSNDHVENLRWGTHRQNSSDRIKHKRDACGSRNGNSKLTEENVLEIIRLQSSLSRSEIANRFRIDPSVISRIVTGKRWTWLTKEVL